MNKQIAGMVESNVADGKITDAQKLESGEIIHTGWNLGRDVAEQCGVNVNDYFNLRGEYLGADANGLEPTFEQGRK